MWVWVLWKKGGGVGRSGTIIENGVIISIYPMPCIALLGPVSTKDDECDYTILHSIIPFKNHPKSIQNDVFNPNQYCLQNCIQVHSWHSRNPGPLFQQKLSGRFGTSAFSRRTWRLCRSGSSSTSRTWAVQPVEVLDRRWIDAPTESPQPIWKASLARPPDIMRSRLDGEWMNLLVFLRK